ncbi:1,4-alpha-glucan branching protein GlgB [Aestuariibacter sp. GS-14]|uniref:1,4-alpha-glucan branching protein GlgB n=1 Tax=Aestuariibacter sp. GS-14 TaxID=2590670 RepID=UPI001126E469|nr:1,4-alpha-glucan branching protein GlgB [Aestuariibacter sp. GS-14]TPV60994.1 1,4-alpha-glucan branching protein GlgB [Aestuariibacter sp. GS-14]
MQYEGQLARAECSQPFSVLGPVYNKHGAELKIWYPGATAVTVLDAKSKTPLGRLAESEVSGLFTGQVKGVSAETGYCYSAHLGSEAIEVCDPYQFQQDAYHAVHFIDHQPQNLYRQAGAQLVTVKAGGQSVAAVRFAVFAPNASAVSLIGDFNCWDGRRHPMQKTDMGYWVLVVPGLQAGERYKYQVKDAHGHQLPHKADPLGFSAEQYPSHASRIYDHNQYQWGDAKWIANAARSNKYQQPMSIYEVHLGSWKRPRDTEQRYLTYRELAEELVNYVLEMGYTHIELLPVSEYPFDGSWGYQPVGLFAPTSRFGSPDEFKYFVDTCHQAGIGVIIDWVPAHFPEDGHGLARFDGTHVYEYEDPRKGWHPDWNSCIYDFGKQTVRQFLVANALYWLEHFHIDGLRVDAVASMLYLDYSRNDGEWIPNVDGGNENYEAISLLRWMNEEVYKHFPHAMTIAEESTSFPKVSRPVFDGGLGFGFKWNMGWMHDSLHYIAKDPAYRVYHHGEMTFSMVYAFDENFVLPISHDEVVHGKGSLVGKMPGDEWQQAANLRSYAAFMFGHPGKKLNFMGNEIAQASEWNHDSSVDWSLLQFDKHIGVQRLYRDLNAVYKQYPALHEGDHDPKGFSWIDHENAEQSVISFVRKAQTSRQQVYVVSNFTPVPREKFRLGVQQAGKYKLVLNTDDRVYWGSGYQCDKHYKSTTVSWNHQPHSIEITLPPLATVFIVFE